MNNKPKILIFIDWFLPGYKAGGPVRSCANMIHSLADEYDFYVFTRNNDYTEINPYPNIKPDIWTQQNGYKAYYVSKNNLNQKTISNILNEINFDIIYINGIYSKWFSILPLKLLNKKKVKPKIIVAARGMFAPTAIKVKYLKKRIFIILANISGLYKHVIFHATNHQEKKQIEQNISNHRQIIIADNFPQVLKPCVHKSFDENVLKLCCIARISPEKNQLYALQVLQSCKAEIDFSIYGPIYDHNYWNDCLELIKMLPKNIRVKYQGVIESDNIAEKLCEQNFLFLPTQGENYGHIIAESLCLGVPVIISNNTPWKNLESEGVGFDIDLKNKQKFIETVDKLAVMNSQKYEDMSIKAHNYFKEKINIRQLKEQYFLLFTT